MYKTFWASSVLHICPVTNSTLDARRQDVPLSLSAGYNRVTSDVRFDGARHIVMK
jgi:hypothetical protein